MWLVLGGVWCGVVLCGAAGWAKRMPFCHGCVCVVRLGKPPRGIKQVEVNFLFFLVVTEFDDSFVRRGCLSGGAVGGPGAAEGFRDEVGEDSPRHRVGAGHTDVWFFTKEWKGTVRQVVLGLLRIAGDLALEASPARRILAHSGTGSLVVEPLRWASPLLPFQPGWIVQVAGEWRATAVERAFAGNGVGFGHRQLCLRRANDGTPPVRSCQLNGAPRNWLDTDVAELLRDTGVFSQGPLLDVSSGQSRGKTLRP